MLEFKAHAFVEALTRLSEFEALGAKDANWVYGNQERVDWILLNLKTLRTNVQLLGLRLSEKKVEYLEITLKNSVSRNSSAMAQIMTRHLEELRERIIGELEVQAIYFVDAKKAEYIKSGAVPFGKEVGDKFPAAMEDIAEAAACLGLNRNTACVFHLMRAMEVAVRRIGDELRVTVTDKNAVDLEWGKIIANIKIPIERMPPGESRDGWSEALTMLYHTKQAWRNGTMHPKQTYGDDEAIAVYAAVKSFMRHLAGLVT